MSNYIIGVTGAAGSGKDTFASMLSPLILLERECSVVHLADKLKNMLWEVDPIVPTIYDGYRRLSTTMTEFEFLYGAWKDGDPLTAGELRRLLQKLGTEAVRGHLGEDVWIDALDKKIKSQHDEMIYIVADVRFDNEAEWVRRNGVLVEILRPDHEPRAGAHSSEGGVSNHLIGYSIVNQGLDDLYDKVKTFYQCVEGLWL